MGNTILLTNNLYKLILKMWKHISTISLLLLSSSEAMSAPNYSYTGYNNPDIVGLNEFN